MKEGWVYKKLGEITQIISGSTPKTSDPTNWNGDNFWVTPAELNGNKYQGRTQRTISDKAATKLKLLPIGTVLLSSRAPIGKVAITTEPMYCNQGFKNIVCPEELYNEFVYWYIFFSVPELEKIGVGATFKELSKSKLESFSIPIPPLAEQQQIVSFLDSEFEKIDALKANAEKQLQAAKDLFQKALKEMLTPKDGWEEKKLNKVCQVVNGRAYKQDEMLATGKYRLLRVGNFFTNDNWYYSDLELDENKYCDNGDLLYAWSASFGPRIWHGEKVIYHYHIWKLICSNHIDKYYLFYWLDSDVFKKQVMKDLHGATMNHITKTIMEATIIKYPSIKEQQAIANNLDALSAKVKQLEKNYNETITLCNDLKQSLLKRIFE